MSEQNGNRNALLVPAVAEPSRQPVPASALMWGDEPDEPSIPLSQYLWILKRQRWKILAFIAICITATAIVSVRLTPIYEATTTIDIDRRIPTGILGRSEEHT